MQEVEVQAGGGREEGSEEHSIHGFEKGETVSKKQDLTDEVKVGEGESQTSSLSCAASFQGGGGQSSLTKNEEENKDWRHSPGRVSTSSSSLTKEVNCVKVTAHSQKASKTTAMSEDLAEGKELLEECNISNVRETEKEGLEEESESEIYDEPEVDKDSIASKHYEPNITEDIEDENNLKCSQVLSNILELKESKVVKEDTDIAAIPIEDSEKCPVAIYQARAKRGLFTN